MAAFNLSLDERAALGMPRTVGRFLSGVAVAVFAYSILFDVLLQANPIPGFPPPPQRFPFPIMRGLFSHAGNFASVMTICAIWSLSSFLFTKRPFDLFVFAAAASSVVGSQRIKGILFVCASLFLAVYAARFMKSGKARGVTVALGSAAVALLTFGMVWFLFDTLFPAERRFYFSEASDALRTKLLLAAVDIARATNGFGAGAGQWGSLTSITHYSVYYWRYGLALTYGATQKDPWFVLDQWWAWYIGEMGWFGFALFLAFCGTCLAMNFRIGRQALRLGPAHAALCVAACLSLLYGVTTGFAAQNMSVAPTGYLVMSLPGLVLAIDW